ncbi:MAG: zinc finger domain-containing protein [Methanomassiliicoccaceae archaeon]|nr:zinc finger domain-containing protein [Methanomassiliicoccaceae archaeon]
MATDKICSSCGIRLLGHGNTFFKCPECGGYEIGRCAQCRDQGISYECEKCGFKGP